MPSSEGFPAHRCVETVSGVCCLFPSWYHVTVDSVPSMSGTRGVHEDHEHPLRPAGCGEKRPEARQVELGAHARGLKVPLRVPQTLQESPVRLSDGFRLRNAGPRPHGSPVVDAPWRSVKTLLHIRMELLCTFGWNYRHHMLKSSSQCSENSFPQ